MKLGFYPKLAWTGMRSNRKLYLPYLITCISMVAMLYIVGYLSGAEAVCHLPGGQFIQESLGLGVWIIALFAGLFLVYSSSFLMRRRKKEFGLYNILGMGKGHLMLGNEVIGVDMNSHHVELLKDKIAASFIMDATDEEALLALPLKEVDVVIVCIGENLGASVRVVAMLKKMGTKRIMARAVDEVHKMILEAFGLDRILTPEKEAARTLVRLLDLQINVESFPIGDSHYVAKFQLPASFVGMKLKDLNLEKDFDLKMISLIRGKKTVNAIGISIMEHRVANEFTENLILDENDELVCYGNYKDFMEFWKAI